MSKQAIERGVYAAALAPLYKDYRYNDKLLVEHCLQLLRRGCKGVVLFGTTGEGASFSTGEKKEILKNVIQRGLPPEKIIVGNGSSCVQDTVDICLAALEHGCLATLLAPPSFFKKIPEAGVIAFYREVIKRIANPHLQVILYHIPQLTGVPLTVPIVEQLFKEFPGIVVGVKESEGNLSFTQALIQNVPGCKVFVGKEKQIPQAIRLGASGAICGIANLYPELLCSLLKSQGVQEQDMREIEEIDKAFEGRLFIPAAKAELARHNPEWTTTVMPPLIS